MTLSTPFNAFRIHNDAAGYRSGIESIVLDALNPGEVVIKTAYSSVNYKDALAGTGEGKILRRFPLVGGIDVAGHVVASTDPAFKEGDAVLVTGCGLSETRDGGYAEYARLEARWVIPLPSGLTLRESMILGTAGFTAALALFRMCENRQTPDLGPLAVTGATGGVGSLAVDIFSRAGFEVHAISGKPENAGYLTAIGARKVLPRDALATTRPMETARFGGGLDNVGGYFPQYRVLNESHCTTIVDFKNADVQAQNLELKHFIDSVLDGRGKVLDASEQDDKADKAKPFNLLYWLVDQLLG